jgi:GNAT superfamily N-acetyltransferase
MLQNWLAIKNGLKLKQFIKTNMFATEFLSSKHHHQYGDWLKSQDDETRQLYFGVNGGPGLVESLVERIEVQPGRHEILVARNCTKWLGTLHIAKMSDSEVEFGIIVHKDYRGEGIANSMLEEAIVWAQNRGYTDLFMHCLGRNKPIQHLCQKHGLVPHNMMGDSEVKVKLNPQSWASVVSEVGIRQRNVYHAFLQNSQLLYQEIYG